MMSEPNEILKMFYEEREKIISRDNKCQSLLAQTESVLKEVHTLKDLYRYVSPRTSQLHSECKNIIQERNDLRELYENINSTLSKKEGIRSIFRRMPEIKNQILSVINSVRQGYQTRQQQHDGFELEEYYGRFFIECRRIKELTGQLESCLSTSNSDELSLHLEEVYSLYFDTREQLIEPIFTRNLGLIISKADRNFCDLLRQACNLLVRTIRSEIQLFNQIFNSVTINSSSTSPSSSKAIKSSTQVDHPAKKQTLDAFLELLCKIFYEHMRPVVIHVNHLETLTELYKLVMETMRLEVQEQAYQVIMSNLAEDIQERMVFRTEVFIQESVLDYKPSRGDLAYPEKLEIVCNGDLKDYQSMWYPTVQRTVVALYHLNRVFDPLVFKDIAQEVVMACLKSLDIAQRLIDERHGGTKIEASLFLCKHLAIIKDQLQSYNIEAQFETESLLTNIAFN